eukprot:CAMPEP_0181209650 /NCGR_PEP_ID=MMETSP1096-20121128/22786_1 /TAXON_ID=156174 ORGANISM="Chrysochromulina ericina, Strain CCMP281" /NCGR_SAMPLE_ID=MMETSP1096 /ASSEMBLY_ACC=CAM_ASM_000453 /LENGTH=77 /DNA_ID=CAMNT_0023300839 /DNA_START=37 /DNA_END=270 /DNA_ORIENTATION=-
MRRVVVAVSRISLEHFTSSPHSVHGASRPHPPGARYRWRTSSCNDQPSVAPRMTFSTRRTQGCVVKPLDEANPLLYD